jgi:TIR domain
MRSIFISYHRNDGDFAATVRLELERANFRVWVDRYELEAGADWREEIQGAIGSSDALVVVLSPESAGSHYVTHEWSYALGSGKPVVPLLLRPATVHPRLEVLQFLDFSGSVRPWSDLFRALCTGEQIAGGSVPQGATTLDPEIQRRELEKKLVGHWRCEGEYREASKVIGRMQAAAAIVRGPYGLTFEGTAKLEHWERPLSFSIPYVSVSPTHIVYVGRLPLSLSQAHLGVAELRLIYSADGERIERLRGEWSLVGRDLTGVLEWVRE